ncbi:hypothetical protein [Companilactobacillus sp.]|uniref:hypothetical protein n=1 Tax=Companilactobacillus sp. TaxID=2767905 RepID=UPI0025B8CC13|nr:hypothetical protein [Companilactobacillus sp.]MCH4009413.1 hypothetical protein [Companilactobacillus sp.]MCH4050408.1 hypothetical protein [Companilactobacillus sp.]MCH4077355.1 hypothetical protein [Companilactobacillus sp.]MCH4125931.1 hypothetical protein [Companilactobacillus sp.]MCI1311640.1 hypothetical protein [Companilactobacillus sp.]
MKKSIILMGIISAMLLAGCSSNSSSSNSANDPANVSGSTSNAYQKLSQQDKKQVKFSFKLTQEDKNKYSVNMTVKNNSSKNISLKYADFSLIRGDETIKSDKKGTTTLSHGQAITINQLFTKVSTTTLSNGQVKIQYLNSDNIVAKPDFSDQINVDDSDDQDSSDTNASSNSSSQTTSSNDDSQSDNSSDSTSQQSDQVVKRADQAEDLYRRATGTWSGGLTVQKTSGGWNMIWDTGANGYVDNNGNVTSSQGVTTTYDEMLHAQQNGGPVKP